MGKGIDQRASASSTGSIWGSPYPLAIVGFSCYLPDATSPEKYWENLFNNRVSYRPYASPRFPNVIYEPDPKGEKKAKKGRSYSNLAALVDFDSFCNIEVPKMRAEFASHGVGIDVLPKAPGHLLALKVALEALRSTGVDPFCLPSSSVGVFCGLVSSNRPEEFSPVNSNVNVLIDVLNELPSFQSLPANLRVSALKSFLTEYPSACVMGRDEFVSDEQPHHLIRSIQAALGLYGTGFAFDAACSSSLLAFELARNYLQCGDLDAAIVGGMTLLAQTHLVSFSEASVHSTKGSFPFDRRADGLIPGEGCVFAVVKSLEKAVVDGDHILAVVRGIGFSSDGRGKSVWAPSLDGQKLALERAFHDAKYHSWSEFDRIEAHATSTQLGDATELQSLSSAMTETPMAENVKIPITSVKANIGHLLEAAGAASVLKVVLELSNEQKLKQTSFAVPSSKFNWNSSPMRILLENEPWKVRSGYIRKACVQAFGIGGLNAQVVIEGPEGSVNVPTQTEPTQLKQIAIIGIGCVLPGAFDISSFKALIDKCESAITPIPQDRARMLFSKADRAESASLFHKARGGFIQGYNYDWKRHRIPPKHIKNANPLQFMTLDAADQAILSAGYRSHLQKVDSQDVSDTSLKALDSHSTAVVVGTRTDGDFLDALRLEVLTPVYRSRLEKVLENEGAAPDVARVIGENFSNAVYNSEDTCLEDETSSGSISTLASRITKTYDLMGGGVTLDAGNISSFTALKNAALLLERRPELRCVVCVSSHSSMNEKSLKKCTEQGITPGEGAVAFVIKRVEDARQDGDRILAVFSRVEEERLKENDAYHACQKLEEFTKNLPTQANDNSPVFIETICDVDRTVERKVNAETKKIAATNVFEIFGETRVSTRDLIGDLRPASGAVAILNAVINMQDCAGNPRAVVSQWDSDGMVAQVKLEKEPIEIKKVPLGSNSMTSTKQKFVHSKHNDRVVFLFPGQGSQYPQMLAPLLRATPEAREVCEKLDDELKSLGFPTFKELAIDNSTALGVDVTATQISLLVADTIIDRTLRKLGIEPDMIAGHSYGEYPAMVAAGTLSFADALRATCERCRIIDETIVKSGTSTGMLSTNAPKEVVQRIFDRLRSRFGKDAFFVSNRNAPDNTIISATCLALDEIAKELKLERCGSVALSVPAGYHSPLVGGVCSPLAEALEAFEFDFPKTPFMSGVSMRFESDPEVIRENLVEQMTKPVDFVEMIERAYRNGGRRFVEVGPKQVLTRLAAKILKDKPDASYYVCDYGPKGINREFDSSVFEALRSPNTVVSMATNPLKKESFSEKKNEETLQSHTVFHSNSLPEDIASYAGGSYEIGLSRGRVDGDRIRRALRRYADVAGSSGEKLLPVVDASDVLCAKDVFGVSGYDELCGIADGAGVPLSALIRHNLSVFPTSREHIPEWGGFAKPSGGCSHFAGFTIDGEFVHGGNIDAPAMNILPNAITSRIAVRRPLNGYASVSILLTGLVGSRGGVNEHGLAATTCDLLDEVYRNAPNDGLRRGVAIQTILDRCATVDEAIEFLKTTKLSGAKAIGLSDASGATALVEYAGDECEALVVKSWFGTNHALSLPSSRKERKCPAHSLARYERLSELLGDSPEQLARNEAEMFAVLRDEYDAKRDSSCSKSRFRTLNMILRSDNAFSWLFHRNAGVIKFKRTYSNTIEPKNDNSFLVFPLKEIMTEYRPNAGIVHATPDGEKNAKSQCSETLFNPLMTPKEYLANIDADYSVAVSDKSLTVRYEDRIIPVPASVRTTTLPQGGFLLISGSVNPLALEVERRILQMGGEVRKISFLDLNGKPKTLSSFQNEVVSLTQGSFPKNVLILTSYDEAHSVFDTKESWLQVRAQGISFPIFTLQSWYKVALERGVDLRELTVVAATRMGGMLGTDGSIKRPDDGAMMGLMRSFQYETFIEKKARVFSFCVDHEYDEEIDVVAQNLIAEIHHDPDFAEDVGFRDGKRYVIRLNACRQTAQRQNVKTDEKPVWVVTGGRRGVTAEIAYALGVSLGAKLCLVGSSDPDFPLVEEALNLDSVGLKEFKKQFVRNALEQKKKPAEEWSRFERSLETRRTLKRFQDAKIEVTSYNCDLSNYEEARALTRRILDEQGKIDGMLFGAGFEKAALFEKSVEETVLKIIDVKVASAIAMLSAFDDTNYPKRLMGMGSISGRLGALGQVGYCVANNMLAKTLAAFANRHDSCRSTVIHWPAWGGVGMAVRPESKFMLESLGIKFMPIQEGVKCFVDEINGVRQPYEICKNDPENNHLYSTEIFPYFSEKGLASIRAEVSNSLNARMKTPSGEQTEVPVGTNRHVTVFIDGNSTEARVLRSLADEIDFDTASVYVITQPREYGAIKANCAARIARRNSICVSVLERVAQWRRARRAKEDDVLVILGVSDVTKLCDRDEGRDYFIQATRLAENADIGGFKIAFVETRLEKMPTLQFLDYALAKKSLDSVRDTKPFTVESRPLVRLVSVDNEQIVSEGFPNPIVAPYLLDHQLKGIPIFPFAMALEAFAETINHNKESGLFWEFQSVKAINGLVFTQLKSHNIRIIATCGTDRFWSVRLVGDRYNADGRKIHTAFPYFSGKAHCTKAEDSCRIEVGDVSLDTDGAILWETEYPERNFNSLYHGPKLQKLRRCFFKSETEMIGEIIAPSREELLGEESKDATLDVAVLDAAFWACGAVNGHSHAVGPYGRKGVAIVPDSIASLRGFAGRIAPDTKCIVRALVRDRVKLPLGYSQVIFDFVVYDENGRPTWQATGFRATEF